jgi:hypothetical protein
MKVSVWNVCISCVAFFKFDLVRPNVLDQVFQLLEALLPSILLAVDLLVGVSRDFLGLADLETGIDPVFRALDVLNKAVGFVKDLLAEGLFLLVAVAAPVGPVHLGVHLLQALAHFECPLGRLGGDFRCRAKEILLGGP